VVNNLLQAVGLVLVAAFCWFVWPPLPLLVVGLVVIVLAEVREIRARAETPKDGES
jgi:hypothetical protein